MRRLLIALFATLAVLTGVPASAAAAVGIITWPDGRPENASRVLSYSFGISHAGSFGHPALGPQIAKTKVSNLSFTKPFTGGSPKYYADAAIGHTAPIAQLEVPVASSSARAIYCMKNVQIDSVHDALAAGDAEPTESVVVSFTGISVAYQASVLNVVTLTFNPKGPLKVNFGPMLDPACTARG